MYQIFLFTKGVSIFLKIRKRQNVNQIVIDDVDMCFTNCVTQTTTTTIFRENSTKILGCKDAGIVYKTHIYVHSNFLSCKMSLVFVFLSLLNFRGRCMFLSFFLPSSCVLQFPPSTNQHRNHMQKKDFGGRKKILNTRDSNVLLTNNFYHQDFFYG